MALSTARLRRVLSLSSSLLHRPLSHAQPHLHLPTTTPLPTPTRTPTQFLQSPRSFTSTTTLSLSARNRPFNPETDEIGPDTILFEGCDYNHWLITIDFPKDPKPSREEMIDFYVKTAAKIFGSEEEAKKKIYALSTTTYQGFQVECSEETSEKFKELPGVVFVLPDSYVDPANKEYGGDKYVNGEIFPRPPPVQFTRNRDRRPQRGQMSYQQQNYGPPHQQNYGPPQQQQNYGPPQQQNYGPSQQQTYGPPRQNYGSPQGPQQQNYGPPQQQNYGPPQQQIYGPPRQQIYGPPQQQNYLPSQNPQQHNYGPQQQQNYDRRPYRDPVPSYEGQPNQGASGNYYAQGNQERHMPPEHRGFVQGAEGYQPVQGGQVGQGLSAALGQTHGTNQGFSQVDQRSGDHAWEWRNVS